MLAIDNGVTTNIDSALVRLARNIFSKVGTVKQDAQDFLNGNGLGSAVQLTDVRTSEIDWNVSRLNWFSTKREKERRRKGQREKEKERQRVCVCGCVYAYTCIK